MKISFAHSNKSVIIINGETYTLVDTQINAIYTDSCDKSTILAKFLVVSTLGNYQGRRELISNGVDDALKKIIVKNDRWKEGMKF